MIEGAGGSWRRPPENLSDPRLGAVDRIDGPQGDRGARRRPRRHRRSDVNPESGQFVGRHGEAGGGAIARVADNRQLDRRQTVDDQGAVSRRVYSILMV